MTEMNEYSELILRLLPPREPKGKYQVEAVVDGLGFWTGGEISLSSADLDEFAPPLEYGRKLWGLLIAGWSELSGIFSHALGKGKGNVRIRVMLDQSPELHNVKWELLTPKDDPSPIGVNPSTPVSRFLAMPSVSFAQNPGMGLKILLAVSSPSNLNPDGPEKPIDVDAEVTSFLDVLERDIREGQVSLTVLTRQTHVGQTVAQRLADLRCTLLSKPATVANIGQELNQNHVLHLIAHGNFNKQGQPIVTLEKDSGEADVVNPAQSDFITQWSGSKPRLVFLQSCRSDPPNAAWLQAGLGTAFVKQGVPAVVAMGDFVEMQAARKFTAGFYRNLVRTGEVDVAANAGRRETYENANSDWAIPVLYSSLRSGERLWRPDPLRSSVRALAELLKDKLEVRKPFPVEVAVFKNLDVARDELDAPTSYARVDALKTARTELLSPAPNSNPVLLIGGRGRAKSSLLINLFVDLALTNNGASASPILVNLADCLAGASASIAVAWDRKLAAFNLPPVDRKSIEDQLAAGTVHLLVDCQDELGGEEFDEALARVTEFLKGKDRFGLIAMDQTVFDPLNFAGMSPTVLIIQDLRPATLKTYLETHHSNLSEDLRRDLAGPFSDIAGIPCLLSRILQLVDRRPIKRSRFYVLDRIVRESLSRNTGTPGFCALATVSLQEMAWRLQASELPHLSVQDTYSFLIAARGSRDFHLDQFRISLIRSELLVGSGPENVRFAYASAHAYFTACYLNSLPPQELRERLGEIVAGLRSARRLKKWQEVLLLLSGQMAEPDKLIGMLLELGFGEGDHLLLAARCVHEANANDNPISHTLVSQVTESLVWWSSPGSGLRPRSRRRAVRGLAYLLRQPSQTEDIVGHLLQLGIGAVCVDSAGKPQADYSPVRLDAMSLLFRNQDVTVAPLMSALSKQPELAQFISDWPTAKVSELSRYLDDPDADKECCTQKALLASLAAFALMVDGSPQAIQCIRDRFLREPINKDLHWMITDGLITLQAGEAARLVELAIHYSGKVNPALSQFVVYAIGRLGSALTIGDTLDEDNVIWQYLAKNLKSDDVILKGRSLRACAEILSNSINPKIETLRSVCQGILLDQQKDFDCLWDEGASRQLQAGDSVKLKKYAIEALEQIGDHSSLDVLRKFYLQRPNGVPAAEVEPLRKISWDAAEKIRLRDPERRQCLKPTTRN